VLTEDRWAGTLSVADFPAPVEALGRMRLPKNVDWRSPRIRRDLAASLRDTGITPPHRQGRRGRGDAHDDAELATLRRAMRAHPCHGCSDREAHARWAERYHRLLAETERLERQVASTTHSLARAFDRIRSLLRERGYLASDGDGVTPNGRRLARLYSESDLLAAECLRTGVWDNLTVPELASVVSTLVFEARRDGPSDPRLPTPEVAAAVQETMRLWASIEDDERRHKLDRTRQPDTGFAWPVYRWARGESLEKVLTAAETNGQEVSAGDFVRWCRQVIDLLDQLRDVLGKDDAVGGTAAEAVKALRRGVVAMGTL
jgi:ATP-dependent RNA helicase HelY